MEFLKNKKILDSYDNEFYNEIIINLKQKLNNNSSILVTTCKEKEGEISVIINVSNFLTRLGNKVLIIDTDFRKNKLYKIIKNSQENIGFIDYLTSNINVKDILFSSKINGLSFMYAGSSTKDVIKLLETKKFKDLVTILKEYFDYIFFLSSPISNSLDSFVISKYCDASMMIVKSNYVKRKVLIDNLSRLKRVNNNFLGVILNDVDMSVVNYESYGHYVDFKN